jgi:DNA-binding IclR family transcriptional regulator/nitroimidazol reductase NimA-like FMN-containing flavoprotein (pyridoxamine 5'-phosphate oxidase superfamily)
LTSEPIIPTAERALRLVELLLEHSEGWTPQELLIELDLSRSALFVLLRALKGLGYVEQTGVRGRYTAGPRLLAWRAPRAPSRQDLLAAFYQQAESDLSGERGGLPRETLALIAPVGAAGRSCQVIAQVEGSALVRTAFFAGQVLDGPSAAALAAAQALEVSPPPQVSEDGYALDTSAEMVSLALPICRDGRTPEAALLLAAPAFRWSPERLVESYLDDLRAMAAHLSYRLGAPYYAPYRAQPGEALQATASLDDEQISAFLRGPYTARLACIRPDGRPHVIPVWQEWQAGSFTVIAWRGSQWADYLQANPNVSLTVDEPWSPLRRVVVSGSARALELTPAEIDRLLQRMTRRYLGRATAPGLGRQVERAFRIRPDALRGWQGLIQGQH